MQSSVPCTWPGWNIPRPDRQPSDRPLSLNLSRQFRVESIRTPFAGCAVGNPFDRIRGIRFCGHDCDRFACIPAGGDHCAGPGRITDHGTCHGRSDPPHAHGPRTSRIGARVNKTRSSTADRNEANAAGDRHCHTAGFGRGIGDAASVLFHGRVYRSHPDLAPETNGIPAAGCILPIGYAVSGSTKARLCFCVDPYIIILVISLGSRLISARLNGTQLNKRSYHGSRFESTRSESQRDRTAEFGVPYSSPQPERLLRKSAGIKKM